MASSSGVVRHKAQLGRRRRKSLGSSTEVRVTRREKVVRGGLTSEHIVQFFDTRESLADSVAAFLAEGCRQGERLILLARPRKWRSSPDALRAGGPPLAYAH